MKKLLADRALWITIFVLIIITWVIWAYLPKGPKDIKATKVRLVDPFRNGIVTGFYLCDKPGPDY